MTLKLFLSCYCNTKPRTAWESYWRHLNGFFTVFSIAKQNSNKTRTVWVSYWGQGKATVQLSPIWLSNCSCLVIVLLCYWKYGKATVHLSPIWHSNYGRVHFSKCKTSWTNIVHLASTNCQMLFFQYQYKNKNNKTRTVWESYWGQLNGCNTVFLPCYCCFFCYWKYGKATVHLSPIWHSNCSCLVIVVCFAIENTVKQPFTCHQYAVWVSYWRQLNGCFTVFAIAKQTTITRQEQLESHIGDNWTVALPYFQ
jgi:hypothetical protein